MSAASETATQTMPATPPAPGTAGRKPASRSHGGAYVVAAALALAPVILFLVVATAVWLMRSRGLTFGYSQPWKPILLVLALLVPVGIVAALVVLVRTRTGRATSLRTRSFFVIAAAILIPAVCLSALGVYAYYRSWQNAATVYSDQAAYRARELGAEIASVDHIQYGVANAGGSSAYPLFHAHLTRGQHDDLTRAIVAAYASAHPQGAWWGSYDTVETNRVLPTWAARRLGSVGYAIGTWRGPSAPGRARLVAWRVGSNDIRYYTDYASSGPAAIISPQAPVWRLVRIGTLGLALIAVLGVLGAWILSRSVVRPVRRLAEASGRLAEGEAGVTVTPEGPRELRELADSFNDMNAKLTKAQETEQAFLLSVSHELKTPLTSIRGYAEGIGDGTVAPPDGSAVIGAESARLERLVGDLLDSARMRKSAFAVRREAVDLTVLAHDVARRYEATARDAGLTLLLNTEAGGGAIADNDRLLQVVSNLVENAIRCTPAPGTVTITTAPGAVTVADTGRGLTGDDLPRAFERFYLYSRYGTDRPVGTGLGLAIVKELTEAMGGTVSVSSAVGVGTAFTVVLPHEEVSTVVVVPATHVTAAAAAPASATELAPATPAHDAATGARAPDLQDDAS